MEKTFEEIVVGDIFASSWGYSMTLNDFYQVVGKSGKSTLLLKKIAGRNIPCGGDGFSGHEEPVKDSFTHPSAPVIKKRYLKNQYIKFASYKRATLHTEGHTYYFNTLD